MKNPILIFFAILPCCIGFAQSVYNYGVGITVRDTNQTGGIMLFVKGSFYNKPKPATTLSGYLLGTGKLIITDTLSNECDSLFRGNKSTLEFRGADTSYILGPNSVKVARMEVNKPINTVIKLQQNITVKSILGFTSGNIWLNGNTINLEIDANLQNETNDRRIYGSFGKVVKIFSHRSSMVQLGVLGNKIYTKQDFGEGILERGHALQMGVADTGSILRFYNLKLKDTFTEQDLTQIPPSQCPQLISTRKYVH